MITEIEIQNYRSIRKDKITLEPLTVLIGANGSGKSNLVKALEFISDIPKSGLGLAVSRQGGQDGMVSKNIPTKEIPKNSTSFEYHLRLPKPDNAEHIEREISVDHKFELTFKANSINVTAETLKFNNVLMLGEMLEKEENSKIETNFQPTSPDSFFSITHKGNIKTAKHEMSPAVTKETLNGYLYWLGLDMFRPDITNATKFKNLLTRLKKGRSRGKNMPERLNGTFLDPNIGTTCDFSPQSRRFINDIQNISRYDLLLHELRREQSPSDSAVLSKIGQNMPAALRKLKMDNVSNYKRLLNSFESIAPHITNINSSDLRTGKEFIEFYEEHTDRGIESWESSDGSLRALAILLAIETSDTDSIIIIEEPEQNLHPWAIAILIDHIREVITEKDIQVILTTHSEHVLNRLNQEEIRVVTRNSGHGTKFHKIEQLIPGSLNMGEIGRMWVKGLLGGVPSN